MMDPRVDELRALLRDDPGSRRFFQLGELLRKEGELVEAESVLRAGLEHHPRYVAAWVSLGRIEFANTRWAEAERCYAHALELDPENTVAARLIGETAEEQGSWERALKAYQLAGMLSGQDPELEAKIALMERRIAGDESYDAPTVPDLPASAVPEPVDVLSDEIEIGEASEPFTDQRESESVFGTVEEAFHQTTAAEELEVFSFSDDDPFTLQPTGDTGVWTIGDDVFSLPAPEPESEIEADVVFAQEEDVVGEPMAAAGREPEPLSDIGAFEVPVPVSAPAVDDYDEQDAAPEQEGEALPEPGFEGELDEIPDGDEDVPLPTLTLARLAIGQNDADLARRTLRSLLQRSPDDPEALRMLAELDGERASSGDQPSVPGGLAAAKATALRGWMDAIRLAAERRTP